VTVTAVEKNAEDLSMTITTELDASAERVWELWSDPRQLERWWGPPTYPATFTSHEFRPGGTAQYYMTGPEGDHPGGWWIIDEFDAPRTLSFRDGFSKPDGTPNEDLPTITSRVAIEPLEAGRTRMTIRSEFPSAEAMEQILAMGMEAGLTQAVGQIDAILAEEPVRA
jgi:uncharacterized protein YndB with AHSA1/START domain